MLDRQGLSYTVIQEEITVFLYMAPPPEKSVLRATQITRRKEVRNVGLTFFSYVTAFLINFHVSFYYDYFTYEESGVQRNKIIGTNPQRLSGTVSICI